MTPSLSFDEHEELVFAAVTKAARVLAQAESGFTRTAWRTFCEQGYFELFGEADAGGLRAAVAVAEALGRACAPGPVLDTFMASRFAREKEREALLCGERVCVVGAPPRFAWGTVADAFFTVADGHIVRLLLREAEATEVGLDGTPYLRGSFLQGERVSDAAPALVVFDVALASYLSQLALVLVEQTAEHARTRKQFGRPIGSFQAVSHPLASVLMTLRAAGRTARAAACAADEGDEAAAHALARAALISARRSALEAAYVCHQKLGAIGITREGPAHRIATRIRALSTRAAHRIDTPHPLLSFVGGLP